MGQEGGQLIGIPKSLSLSLKGQWSELMSENMLGRMPMSSLLSLSDFSMIGQGHMWSRGWTVGSGAAGEMGVAGWSGVWTRDAAGGPGATGVAGWTGDPGEWTGVTGAGEDTGATGVAGWNGVPVVQTGDASGDTIVQTGTGAGDTGVWTGTGAGDTGGTGVAGSVTGGFWFLQ